ncbi:hypothetical protein ACIBCD_38605 [Nocardia brasiliensis]|uniref:hypothetical protein n=1 Tax=Nocardia brasiliensis TaxID=37326 RepID=UPI0037B4659C
MDEPGERDWQVLLLGGASGSGKSRLSYPLARHYRVPLVEVDDLVLAVQAMTTPAQQPMLHYWDTIPIRPAFRFRRSWSCRLPAPRLCNRHWRP